MNSQLGTDATGDQGTWNNSELSASAKVELRTAAQNDRASSIASDKNGSVEHSSASVPYEEQTRA